MSERAKWQRPLYRADIKQDARISFQGLSGLMGPGHKQFAVQSSLFFFCFAIVGCSIRQSAVVCTVQELWNEGQTAARYMS